MKTKAFIICTTFSILSVRVGEVRQNTEYPLNGVLIL